MLRCLAEHQNIPHQQVIKALRRNMLNTEVLLEDIMVVSLVVLHLIIDAGQESAQLQKSDSSYQ